MRLHDADWAPNPRRVRIYLAEKGLEVPRRPVDLRAGEHLGEAYRAENPFASLPVLELDDGELIPESAAICRYFEVLHPEPPLFGGGDARAVARIESWTRRIEHDGYAAVVNVLRNSRPAFADRPLPGAWPPMVQLPALAERGEMMWEVFVRTVDAQLGEMTWIAGEAYSFADITLLTTVDFAGAARLAVPEACANLRRWHTAASARRSAKA